MMISYKGVFPRVAKSAFVAASADVIGEVEIAEDASIWYQTVLRGDIGPIRVGKHTNIQDGSVLHSITGVPVEVGEWVTVGHRAILHGCTVEDRCLIGMGAIVLNRARVGAGSIVAAGALVLEDTVIPQGSLYVGVPAKLRRKLTERDQAFIDAHSSNYLKYKDIYLAESGSKSAS